MRPAILHQHLAVDGAAGVNPIANVVVADHCRGRLKLFSCWLAEAVKSNCRPALNPA